MAGENMITLHQEDLRRLHVIQNIIDGFIGQEDAAKILSLSKRQIRRIVKRIRSEGSSAIIHRSRGRPSNRTVSGKKERLKISREQYEDIEGLQWLIKVMKEPKAIRWTEKMRLRPEDVTELLQMVAKGTQRESGLPPIIVPHSELDSLNRSPAS